MRSLLTALLLGASMLLAVSVARADLVSTFDADAEGWTIYGNGVGAVPDWEATGGNPGGFIKDTDGVASTWYFEAPASWSGDLSAYVGGTLSFQIIVLYAFQGYFSDHDVCIWDGPPGELGSAYLYWNSGIVPPRPPDEAWTEFSVQILPENFGIQQSAGSTATFESIMANVVAIHLRGEYMGAGDREGLDNAQLVGPAVPVGDDLPSPNETSRLTGMYPNPFNPRVVLHYELTTAGPVTLAVYDLRGRWIRTLVEGPLPAGRYETAWDGRDGAGRALSSGVYVVRLDTLDGRDVRKVTLAK